MHLNLGTCAINKWNGAVIGMTLASDLAMKFFAYCEIAFIRTIF